MHTMEEKQTKDNVSVRVYFDVKKDATTIKLLDAKKEQTGVSLTRICKLYIKWCLDNPTKVTIL
jgi:ACT domain-containing protein